MAALENKHDPDRLSISATKHWNDENNKYNLRPTEIKLKLQYRLDNGNDENGWQDVPYDPKGFSGKENVSFRSVTVEKPETVTGTSTDTNIDTNTVIVTVGVIDKDIWEKATWHDLPAKAWQSDASGPSDVRYRVIEADVPTGYESAGSGIVTSESTNKTAEVTNSLEGTSWTVRKAWNPGEDVLAVRGLLPDKVEVKLQYLKAGRWEDVPSENAAEYLSSDNNWQFTFDNLPKGNTYRAIEVSMIYGDGENSITIKPDANGKFPNGMTVTSSELKNTEDAETSVGTLLTNTLETASVTAHKKWNDLNNRYNMRPASLTFKLQNSTDGINWTDVPNGGNNAYTFDMTDPWAPVTFDNLPKYTLDGTPYQYQVVEETSVPGYENTKPAERTQAVTLTLPTPCQQSA